MRNANIFINENGFLHNDELLFFGVISNYSITAGGLAGSVRNLRHVNSPRARPLPCGPAQALAWPFQCRLSHFDMKSIKYT